MAKWPSGVKEFCVTAEVVGEYVAAVGGSWRPGADPVPSTLASVVAYPAVAAMPVKSGVVLTAQEFDFHRPFAVSDRLRTRYEVTEEYERRGRHFMVLTTRTTDADDRLVVLGRTTRMLPVIGEGA